ncbi:MAG TPA: hypothetical protein VES42_24760 [Pilimelia sp.]|nr:hypothetical protein [Pilimelia sp.]
MRMHVSSPALLLVAMVSAISAMIVGAAVLQAPAWAATPPQPLIISHDSTIAGLSPGSGAQAINYTITNPNDTPVFVSTVSISMSNVVYLAAAGTGVGTTAANHPAGGPAPGCTGADFTIVAPDPLGRELLPGQTSFTRHTADKSGTIAMRDRNTDQNACQGTTGTLAISIA